MSHPPPPSSPPPSSPPPLTRPEPVYTGPRSHSPEELQVTPDARQPSPSAEHIAFVDEGGPGGEPRPRNGTYGSMRPGRANSRNHRSETSLNEFARGDNMPVRRQSTYATAQLYPSADRAAPIAPGSQNLIDYVVPSLNEKMPTRRTVLFRLQPTIDGAENERNKCARKAQITGWTLNAAIGLQVLLGSLTTGLSAVASGNIAVSTVILGGLSTLVASYLARARGSNEPELSITRTKDLEQFLRECKSFVMDHGHKYGIDDRLDNDEPEEVRKEKIELESRIEAFRYRFEELLGNANGERKLSSILNA